MCLSLSPRYIQNVIHKNTFIQPTKKASQIFSDAGLDFAIFLKHTGFQYTSVDNWNKSGAIMFDAVVFGYKEWLSQDMPECSHTDYREMIESFGIKRLDVNKAIKKDGNYNVIDMMFKRNPTAALIVVLGVLKIIKREEKNV